MLMGSHLCGNVVPQLAGAAWLCTAYKPLLRKGAFPHALTVQATCQYSSLLLWKSCIPLTEQI